MKKRILLIGLVGAASSALAEPCVTATFDRPLDDAENVAHYVSDVPSAQFPAFWQTGLLNGFRYKVFASSEGGLRPTDNLQDWEIAITCKMAGETCTLDIIGVPPQAANDTANIIGQCLLGIEQRADLPETIIPVQPNPELPTSVETEPQQAADLVTCGVELVDEQTSVATLQRLLHMAGENPGPVDGFLGPKSFAAMESFVENPSWATSIPATIALVDRHLCEADFSHTTLQPDREPSAFVHDPLGLQ